MSKRIPTAWMSHDGRLTTNEKRNADGTRTSYSNRYCIPLYADPKSEPVQPLITLRSFELLAHNSGATVTNGAGVYFYSHAAFQKFCTEIQTYLAIEIAKAQP